MGGGHKKYTEKEPAWKTYAQTKHCQIYRQQTGRERVECIHHARIRNMWSATVNEVKGHQAQ